MYYIFKLIFCLVYDSLFDYYFLFRRSFIVELYEGYYSCLVRLRRFFIDDDEDIYLFILLLSEFILLLNNFVGESSSSRSFCYSFY